LRIVRPGRVRLCVILPRIAVGRRALRRWRARVVGITSILVVVRTRWGVVRRLLMRQRRRLRLRLRSTVVVVATALVLGGRVAGGARV
jgi:hypothetical protein